TVKVGGTGKATIVLNDLSAANGTTNITLAALTHDNTVTVQSSSVTAEFGNFNITSFGSGNNTYNVQDQAGTLKLDGAVNFSLGSGNDMVNLAADSCSPYVVTH